MEDLQSTYGGPPAAEALHENEYSIDLSTVPIKALKKSTRNKLAEELNVPMMTLTHSGKNRDWQGLAELAGCDCDEIEDMGRNIDPTSLVLRKWQERNYNCPSVAKLIDCLEEITRFDVLDDLMTMFYRDGADYLHRVLQVREITSTPQTNSLEQTPLTTLDSKHMAAKGKMQLYDAYVCYTKEDEGFALELKQQLEDVYKFQLCFKERDLLAGTFEHDAVIELIQTRCRRMLVVMSPAFLNSNELQFQYLFAQALSIEEQKRRIIPIIYKPCQLVPKFRFLAALNYSKGDMFNCFWERLVQSIGEHPQSISNNLFPNYIVSSTPVILPPITSETRLFTSYEMDSPSTPESVTLLPTENVSSLHADNLEAIPPETASSSVPVDSVYTSSVDFEIMEPYVTSTNEITNTTQKKPNRRGVKQTVLNFLNKKK